MGVCIIDSLCYIAEANTTFQISYAPIKIKSTKPRNTWPQLTLQPCDLHLRIHPVTDRRRRPRPAPPRPCRASAGRAPPPPSRTRTSGAGQGRTRTPAVGGLGSEPESPEGNAECEARCVQRGPKDP